MRKTRAVTACVGVNQIQLQGVAQDFKLDVSDKVHEPTFVQASPAFFPHNSLQASNHIILWTVFLRHMHSALDCDVRIRDARRQQLPDCSKVKRVSRQDSSSSFLERILQLLKYRVLQNRIDDEYQGGQYTRKECGRAFLAEEREKGADCRGLS